MKLNLKLNKTNELGLEEEDKKDKCLEEKKKSKKKVEKEKNIVDNGNRLKTLKKKIYEKYGLKNRFEMMEGIQKIINNDSISLDEFCNLHYVLRYLYEVH